MKLEVERPTVSSRAPILKTVMQRRGHDRAGPRSRRTVSCRIESDVPLAEMFGYATDLRSMHPGQGRVHHGVRPLRARAGEVQKDLIKEHGGNAAADDDDE